MGRDDAVRLLASHGEELKRFGVRSLGVFGSVARNEARMESDVDLLVDFEEPPTFDRYATVANYLEDLLGRPVDLVMPWNMKAPVRRLVEKELQYVPGLSPVSG
jgi:uncharacterized protein